MSSQKDSENSFTLPSFPVRWFMYFRRYPYSLLNFRLLSGVISGRGPVLWDNFMKGENIRRLREQEKAAQSKPTGNLGRGAWREDNLPRLGSGSHGKWMNDD